VNPWQALDAAAALVAAGEGVLAHQLLTEMPHGDLAAVAGVLLGMHTAGVIDELERAGWPPEEARQRAAVLFQQMAQTHAAAQQ
jgi:hypothetical protein